MYPIKLFIFPSRLWIYYYHPLMPIRPSSVMLTAHIKCKDECGISKGLQIKTLIGTEKQAAGTGDTIQKNESTAGIYGLWVSIY